MTTATGNSIIGISTSSFDSTEVVSKDYVNRVVTLPALTGNSGTFLYSTDGTSLSWQPISTSFEYRTYGEYTFSIPQNANIFFIEAVGAGGGGGAGTINGNSGAGGGAGAYTSWYVPKSVLTSDLTIRIGLGGTGGTSDGQTGSAGAATTITWTGPNGTYTLVSAAGGPGTTSGPSQQVISSYYLTIFGGAGGPAGAGAGSAGVVQGFTFQSTGGGAGGKIAVAGVGGTIYAYNVAYAATAGTASGTNGGDGITFDGLPLGGGAGGGGASAGVSGNGGNGTRGSGAGGGGSNTTNFGNGGNGGDGYVRVRWW